MSAAVALSPAPLSHMPSPPDRNPSPRSYAAIAPLAPTLASTTSSSKSASQHTSSSTSETAAPRLPGDCKTSPNSLRSGPAPRIIVKKEPLSPTLRHRPQKLDLSRSLSNHHPSMSGRPSAPLPSKESVADDMQKVGIACLSPGFQTQDPGMQQQLQKSLELREHQKRIIEARMHKGVKGHESLAEGLRAAEPAPFETSKTPTTSRRKGPPPGLTIAPPSHKQFAEERVIQSAPLNQSFTGLRGHPALTRHLINQPSNLSSTSHIHHVPATQTNNRLPPISDVFASEGLSAPRSFYHNYSPGNSSHSNIQPPLPSPGFPPPSASQPAPLSSSSRPREYKSAEEAVQFMSGGREDLLPRIVHYGGHQPPTPPSPNPHSSQHPHPPPLGAEAPHRYSGSLADGAARTASGSGRRRTRDEYERDMGSPPLRQEGRRGLGLGPFGEGRDSPESQRAKKEEFLGLCARAWDLFHS